MADEEEQGESTWQHPEEWSSDSNQCFHISLIRANGEQHANFQPEFTYTFFDENERIFGYQGLAIELSFAAHDLEPRLNVSWDAEYKEAGDIQPMNIPAILADFLPAEALLETRRSTENVSSFVPPGKIIRSYSRGDQRYEIRCASLADPQAKRLLQNMQVLIPMFIEGGSMLQLEQDWTTERWKLFTVWLVDPSDKASDYSLIGYGTSYRVFSLPRKDSLEPEQTTVADVDSLLQAHDGVSPLELPSRERLSQFLVLPNFQGSGHGRELYRAMYKHLTAEDNVREFTVEDPNESFDDLRDFCDLTLLRARHADFEALEINPDIPAEDLASDKTLPTDLIVSKEQRDQIRTAAKIETRQFNRLVEAHTLSKIPAHHRERSRLTRKDKASNKYDRQYYFWRLYVKQRLLIFNEDALKELTHEEKVEKLEGAVDTNQAYFTGLIEKAQNAAADVDLDGDDLTSTNERSSVRAGKKRKIITDEDEDEVEDDVMSTASKRSRIA